VSSGVFLDSALIDPELSGQFINGNAVGVSLDQLLNLGRLKSPPETFSLVKMVQLTSHDLHSPAPLPSPPVPSFGAAPSDHATRTW